MLAHSALLAGDASFLGFVLVGGYTHFLRRQIYLPVWRIAHVVTVGAVRAV